MTNIVTETQELINGFLSDDKHEELRDKLDAAAQAVKSGVDGAVEAYQKLMEEDVRDAINGLDTVMREAAQGVLTSISGMLDSASAAVGGAAGAVAGAAAGGDDADDKDKDIDWGNLIAAGGIGAAALAVWGAAKSVFTDETAERGFLARLGGFILTLGVGAGAAFAAYKFKAGDEIATATGNLFDHKTLTESAVDRMGVDDLLSRDSKLTKATIEAAFAAQGTTLNATLSDGTFDVAHIDEIEAALESSTLGFTVTTNAEKAAARS